MTLDFYENLQKATNNLNDIVFVRYGVVTKVFEDKVNVLVDDSLEHENVPVLNNLILRPGEHVVVGFVDNSFYNPFIIGALDGESSPGGVQSDWSVEDPSSLAFIKNKPVIPDVSDFYTKSETDSKILNHHDSSKEDVISDLDTIRAGAYLGAIALQTGDNISSLVNDKDYASKNWIKWYNKQPLSLNLTSNNQYVLAGESSVLTCTLHNNKGKGFLGEVINLNDSVLSTNNEGVATQTITGITTETRFNASYEDYEKEIIIYLGYLKDSFNHQSLSGDWTNTGIESISYDTTEECLKFENTVSTGNIVSTSSKLFIKDFIIEFDLQTATPYNMQIGVRNEANTSLSNKRCNALSVVADTWAHIKIVRRDKTITYYTDNEEKASESITTVPARFRFHNDAVNSFMIKNFIAYSYDTIFYDSCKAGSAQPDNAYYLPTPQITRTVNEENTVYKYNSPGSAHNFYCLTQLTDNFVVEGKTSTESGTVRYYLKVPDVTSRLAQASKWINNTPQNFVLKREDGVLSLKVNGEDVSFSTNNLQATDKVMFGFSMYNASTTDTQIVEYLKIKTLK